MLETTISSIRMLAAADPETDKAAVDRIITACRAPQPRRVLIKIDEARTILGDEGKPLSEMSFYKWVKRGLIHPIKHTKRHVRYDKAEIENLANFGSVFE